MIDVQQVVREFMDEIAAEAALGSGLPPGFAADRAAFLAHFEANPPAVVGNTVDVAPLLRWSAQRWGLDLASLFKGAEALAAPWGEGAG